MCPLTGQKQQLFKNTREVWDCEVLMEEQGTDEWPGGQSSTSSSYVSWRGLPSGQLLFVFHYLRLDKTRKVIIVRAGEGGGEDIRPR